jgi:hypothetical protein
LARRLAAIVMRPAQSAKPKRRHSWACERDVPRRLSSHLNSHIDELLPHRWIKPDA